ncbi:MAG: hypothetical protein Q8P01_03150 [bacterium]|nr:hypothetical protein [bacterium]
MVWQLYQKLTEVIWATHAEAGMLGGGHDPDHAIRVAQMALNIAPDENTARLAAAAGLCHNADRVLQKKMGIGRREVPENKVRGLVCGWLEREPTGTFSVLEFVTIVDAVVKHDGRNNESDHPILVTLMDADRLVNAEPDLIMRSGAHYSDLPAVDLVHLEADPDANYRDPKSILRDVMETIVWLTPGTDFYVRLPKAQEIAARRKAFFDNFLASLKECLKETGFYPYPSELLALREKYAEVKV